MLIDLKELVEKYNLKINGVIHIGAHHAEELELYNELGIKNVIWVEANPELIETIEGRVNKYGHQVFNYAISNENVDHIEFKISENTQASSILSSLHITHYHPESKHKKTISVPAIKASQLFSKDSIRKYNFVNLDIQGAELSALKSFGEILNYVDYVYSEVNIVEHYQGLGLLSEIDSFLFKKKFTRKEIKLTRWKWGDAFYIKGDISKYEYVLARMHSHLIQMAAKKDRIYHLIKPYEH